MLYVEPRLGTKKTTRVTTYDERGKEDVRSMSEQTGEVTLPHGRILEDSGGGGEKTEVNR